MSQALPIESALAAIKAIDKVSSMLEVVCKTTGMGFAAITHLTEDSWVACAVRDEIGLGILPGASLKLDTAAACEPIVIAQAAHGSGYALYGQSFISVPIVTKGGTFFGTLCAIGAKSAPIDRVEIMTMFQLFADLIAFHLQAQADAADKAQQLNEAAQTAELRDKVIAILGHDVRNPVAAVLNVAELLLRMPVDDRVKKMATIVQRSTTRIRALIENLLDFSRGHLGNGLKLELADDQPLGTIFSQVIEEQLAASPFYKVEAVIELDRPFNCDAKRMAQLLANLLSNALTHGQQEEAVQVIAKIDGCNFIVSVTNKGAKIGEQIKSKLFQPFYKGDIEPSQRGLGLGLYIAAEIAKAHKGKLEVNSTDEFTCFTFSMEI
jgi:signal transduction histidine kinase